MFNSLKKLSFETWVAILTLVVILTGGVLYTFKYTEILKIFFNISLLILSLPILYGIIKSIIKGHFGVDLIAGVAIVGAFLLGENLAGLVVVLMLSGGQTLETYAMSKAKYELTRLLARAPTHAIKIVDGIHHDVHIEEVNISDEILIKSGTIIPVDGVIITGASLVDESSLTGESVPQDKTVGMHVSSGTENTSGMLTIKALKKASDSHYAKIVALVQNASESRAPLVRLADKYAVFFTIVTFIIGAITWIIFHDWIRVLAVLVVATPCPLILATPIAIISGMSRSAKRGVIIKDGGALEKLSRVKSMLFDKTGTITMGAPMVNKINIFKEGADVMGIASSLDLGSSHILARSFVKYAKENNANIYKIDNFKEVFGDGVIGEIENEKYIFGKFAYLEKSGIEIGENIKDDHNKMREEGKMVVYLGDSKQILGSVVFADAVRTDAKKLFLDLQDKYKIFTLMITGDSPVVAKNVASMIGIQNVHAGCKPEEKVALVDQTAKVHGPVAMIGDGINDAPALARADVGIAIASHGDTASTDTADIVIIHNSISKVIEVYIIALKTVKIAKEGIFIGIGLSVIAMIFALLGYITPLTGAILQEGIDVFVILSALRALRIKVE
ncbi:heavy metal translocating P-type ATPase [Candidatus Nomurabacteria bacterium]|nr:heavy metal translocating P-type ATPase [Candidatus Nomurabacteria bacterium]